MNKESDKSNENQLNEVKIRLLKILIIFKEKKQNYLLK